MIKNATIMMLAILFLTMNGMAQTEKKSIKKPTREPHKNILKVTFLSWFTGSTKLSYERYLFNNQSIEATAGVIGWGYDKYKNNPSGAIFRVAYKFILFNTNSLQGFYLRPEFAYTTFNYDSKEVVGTRVNSSMGTVMATVGYQWCSHIFVIDGFVGAGLGLGSPREFNYHHSFIDIDQWLTLTFGVKLGFTFGERDKEKKKKKKQ